MKKFLSVLLCFLSANFVMANEATWLEDHAKALEQAKTEKKLLLMDFTGSDWCGWCIKLDKEVFNQKEFKDYAAANLVLLKLDFPRKKTQSDKLKTQNAELAEKYRIEGFPTIIVLNPEGKKISKLGYMEGGPASFIAALKKLKP